MIIKIDTREHDLFKQLKNLILFIPSFKGLTLVSETLPIGDIIITTDEKEEKLIIERKCINDLLSSIKDGRYEEQSYRLNGLHHHNHNIYYLIEGDVNRMNRFKENNIEKLTVYSSMFSLNYYKGFSVMRTFTIEETAIFICNTANKLQKTDKLPFYNYNNNNNTITSITKPREKVGGEIVQENTGENSETHIIIEDEVEVESIYNNESTEKNELTDKHESSEKDYVSVIKKVKKDNITVNNIGEIILCQIPGISSVTALAIMDKFKTIPNLIKEVDANVDCLQNISYTNAKGQTRKITKTSIANIVTFLLQK